MITNNGQTTDTNNGHKLQVTFGQNLVSVFAKLAFDRLKDGFKGLLYPIVEGWQIDS